VTGSELRTAREAIGARRSAVARLLGVSHTRIVNLEGQAFVTEQTADRVLAAVEILAVTYAALDLARAVLAAGRAADA